MAYYPPVNYPLNWNPLATNQPSFNPPPAARPPPSAAHPPTAANPPVVPANNPQQQPNVTEPITADQQAASPRQGWVGQTGSPPASDSAALPAFDPNYKLGPEHLGNFIYYAMATDENPVSPFCTQQKIIGHLAKLQIYKEKITKYQYNEQISHYYTETKI
jgi:hypothetical protein